MARPILEVKGLTTTLAGGTITILEDVSFGLQPGEVLGVVGESGSGKSMLALSVMGLLPKAVRRTAGRIVLDGEDLAALSPDRWRERRGSDLAMIFQEPMTALNPVMRVGDQVAEVLRRQGIPAKKARQETINLFRKVEIPSPEQRVRGYPHELSGGMRQRVMIAIALAANPKVLIADEPTTALDVTVQAQILDLLRKLQKERGLSLVFITHDLGVIAEIADRVLVLYAGRVAEIAPVRKIFDNPQHPYTRALLASIPEIDRPRGRLVTIEGAVPSIGAMPKGCRYASRCPFRRDICEQESPRLGLVSSDQAAACVQPFGFEKPQEEALA
ncbi:ABC transporter ATP-binding protein [Microvirga makkahensis]|uniref:ATP-binding cassette domain-containing protein n=1 Tax=Microvirga makkahensis TaxID=1128670 RepID=A0A7X3MSH0_9HYPH|nr:ABC transporter ATP-binding protein [Microvirga makkahensis]MXQ12175.1 ATP-binding cassette domain-containing protein [Microvirga makkahensis]